MFVILPVVAFCVKVVTVVKLPVAPVKVALALPIVGALIIPPTNNAPCMPAPPVTCNAPVNVLVLVVLGRILTLPALAQATCTLEPVDPE